MKKIFQLVAILIVSVSPVIVPQVLQNAIVSNVYAQDSNTSSNVPNSGASEEEPRPGEGSGTNSDTPVRDTQTFAGQNPETRDTFNIAVEGTGLTAQQLWEQERERGTLQIGNALNNPDQSGLSSSDMAALTQAAIQAKQRQEEINLKLIEVRRQLAGLEVNSVRWTELSIYENTLIAELGTLASQIASYAEAQRTFAEQQQQAVSEAERYQDQADRLTFDLQSDLGANISASQVQSLLKDRPELRERYGAYAGLPGNIVGKVLGQIMTGIETDPGKIGAAVAGFLTSLGVTDQSAKEAAAVFAYNTALGTSATPEGRAAAAVAVSNDASGRSQVSAHLTVSRINGLTPDEIEAGVKVAIAANTRGYDFGISLGRTGGALNAYGENVNDVDAREAMRKAIMDAAIRAGMSSEDANNFANQAMLGYIAGKGAARNDLGVPAPPDPPTGDPTPTITPTPTPTPAPTPAAPGVENGTLSIGGMSISIPAGTYSRSQGSPEGLSVPSITPGTGASSQELKFEIPNGGGTFAVTIQVYQNASSILETVTATIEISSPAGNSESHKLSAPTGITIPQINDTFARIVSPSDFATKASNAGWRYKQ